jgi:hypothetical protein
MIPYTRTALAPYGVKPTDTHVCEWVADDQQSSIVVGLGPSAEAAKDDAVASANRREFEIDGGALRVSEIADC